MLTWLSGGSVARARVPEFKRLSFVLIGVATPGDLIRDSKRTPFNIGQRVDLTDFNFEESLRLAEGLRLPPDESRQALGWVLKWTGGHPYLTQRLCSTMMVRDAADLRGDRLQGSLINDSELGKVKV